MSYNFNAMLRKRVTIVNKEGQKVDRKKAKEHAAKIGEHMQPEVDF